MSSIYGEKLHISIFGQSHSGAVGVTMDGFPSGFAIDFDRLGSFLKRRSPCGGFSTAREEKDETEFLSGLRDGVTCGAPLTAVIRNTDCRRHDYDVFAEVPRPGHADYTGYIKYGESRDFAGGGHFSGRLTAPLCIAGGICIQFLETCGIKIISRIAEIGGIRDEGELLFSTAEKKFPVVTDSCGEKMLEEADAAKAAGDSLGGIIECAVMGIPAGIGDPMFGGMENRIAQAVFAVPAVKGIEFGAGFSVARMRGSENNDSFTVKDGRICTVSNNCGGILGGITDGMPLVFRAAVKPAPSIKTKQQSVNMKTLEITDITVSGRHDACIVPRAVPCVEAAAGIAVLDALLSDGK